MKTRKRLSVITAALTLGVVVLLGNTFYAQSVSDTHKSSTTASSVVSSYTLSPAL